MVELWILVLIAHPVVNGLKIINMYVPRGATHEAPMVCRYDLEGEKLYDVKWYKDDRQFLKCAPDGSVQEFPLDGISLEYPRYAPIGSCPVTITRLSGQSGGTYRCEVSVDGPPFFSASQTKMLRVVQFHRQVQEESEVKSAFQNWTAQGGGVSGRNFDASVMFLLIF
ncbi:uncharacterized protein LOC126750023 [Anthonomus grandis grandis]|nr:uncharacterized protein LOC126750023 [Anthonomus grandis grandis]